MWSAKILLASMVFAGVEPQRSLESYIIDHWGSNEGLPQNSVLSIVQTTDKYLWLATFGGLVRFDGLAFTTFDSGTNPGIRSNRVLALAQDHQGTLWIATQEGGLASFSKGRFATYGTEDGLPSRYIRTITVDRQGDVWAATWKGLARHRSSGFDVYGTERGLSGTDILALAAGAEGGVWVSTNVAVHLVKDGKITCLLDQPANAILEDRLGQLWLGTNQGLRMSRRTNERSAQTGPVTGAVHALYQSSDGAIWAGASSGLWRLHNGHWTLLDAKDGLSENDVRAITEDSEGNLWIGTNARGLNRLKKRRVAMFGTAPGIRVENFVPVIEDRTGAKWFGSTCGGLVRLAGGRYRIYTERDGLASDCVWSLLEDRDGSLWIGGRNGLSRLRDGKFKTFDVRNSSLPDNWVPALLQDHEGTLWVGTGSGLARFRNGVFTVFRKKDGLVEDDVRFLTEDHEGAIWIGTTGGMSRLHGGKFSNFTTQNGLPHRFVRAIHFDSERTLWIGTYGGGLSRYKDQKFFVFNTSNGLAENIVSRILEDEDGHFWLSGNRGIHRVSRRQLEAYADNRTRSFSVHSFDATDGMKNRECNGGGSPAGWKSRDGRLWFPTQQGVAVIDPARIEPNMHAPAVSIERILVNGEAASTSQPVHIPPGRSDLQIRYAGLSPTSPERVRFRFRLEGLDADWTDAGTRREAYYTHLPPGRLRFVVVAANGDGIWNVDGAGVEIVVVPPFWATWWFRVILAASAVAATVLLVRLRVRHLERANREQTNFSRRLIQSQESERKRIAAELHDSLGQTLAIIRNRALVSLSEPANHSRALEQMDEIASAAGHALDEVRNIAYDLRPFHLDRLGLGKAIEVMLARASGAGPVEFTAEVNNVDAIFPPALHINVYRIIQEAVSNVLKHSGATQGKVKIQETPLGVAVRIEDNGKGFLLNSAGTRNGLGLNGIAERARLSGGNLRVETAPGSGTVINIAFSKGAEAWQQISES